MVDNEGESEPSTCLVLHRCNKYGGCCQHEHQECTVSRSETVEVDVTVRLRVRHQHNVFFGATVFVILI